MKNIIIPSNNRLCVNFKTLIPSVEENIINQYLNKRGFKRLRVDIINLARKQLGKKYERGYKNSLKNPETFDCSSFNQWLYGQKGIYIPRISIDQRDFGMNVSEDELLPGDLLFTTGHINYYWDDDKENAVGHTGIFTGESVIHAANKERGVVEDSLADFLKNNFRGATRIYDHLNEAETIIIPKKEKLEYDLHLRWRILRSLSY